MSNDALIAEARQAHAGCTCIMTRLADALEQAEVKARRQALLDAAGDVCGYCAVGDNGFWERGVWYHKEVKCAASKIQNRIQHEQEQQ